MKSKLSILIFLILIACSATASAELPMNFNNCQVSLGDGLEELERLKQENNLNFDTRIVREVTDRDECIDMILGTNLEQGARLENGQLVDLVVGIKKNEVTETVKETELDLYMKQLKEKNIENLNLIDSPVFGNAKVTKLIEGQNLVSYIKQYNLFGYELFFAEAEGKIYGVKSDNKIDTILDITNKTIRERESGLHTFDFISLNQKTYLIVTYSGTDSNYYLSSYEITEGGVLGDETVLVSFPLANDTRVHFGGKILTKDNEILLCLGDLNSPGNSAKFDSPWGKVLSIKNDNLIESKVTSLEDPRLSVIAYGLRNPWSCFFHKSNFVIPDVGNSHWEEVNVIENFSLNKEPVFFGWPWFESYFDANYKNMPVSEETKDEQISLTQYPKYTYPHASDFCAIIGGTELENSEKWGNYFFVGDFCTGTIWAIDIEKNSKLSVLEKNLMPYSITTINDSGKGTLLVGTTSGEVLEIELP